MRIDVSIGEVVDKATILSIKLEKIASEEKLVNIRREFDLLRAAIEGAGIPVDSEEFRRLREVNLRLWDIEDRIRLKERAGEFDDEFVRLARDVYFTNDRRFGIKSDINLKFESDLVEEMECTDYREGR